MITRRNSLEPIDFDGLRILDYTANANLDCSLATIDVPPGGRHPKAWSRRSGKYYLVTDGRVQFTVDDEIAELAKGDFCFIRQGTVFSYANVSSEPAALVLVHAPAFEMSAEVFVD